MASSPLTPVPAWRKIDEALSAPPAEFTKPTPKPPPATDDDESRFGPSDPTLPPNAEKKRAYKIWFASIIVLEFCMIRRAMFELNEFTERGVWNQFLLHSQLLNIAVHLVVDFTSLRALNAFGGASGLSFPKRLGGAPVLTTSEENTLLFRHTCKLIQRNPLVNSMLLGGKPDGFHAYQVQQIFLMVVSPTFFSVLLAVKSTHGLCQMALINAGFLAAHVLLMPFAFKYTDTLREAYFAKLGPEEVWRKHFFAIGVFVAAAPFASRFAVRFMRWEFADLRDTSGAGKVGLSHNELAGRANPASDPADIKNLFPKKESVAIGLRPDGGTELSASAVCFKDGKAQFVVVKELLVGVMLRVTFDGRVLHTSTEPTLDPVTGETHALLKVFLPDFRNGGQPPCGLAWVATGRKDHQRSRDTASMRRGLRNRGERGAHRTSDTLQSLWNDDSFAQVGKAVPLLFLDTPEVAREVNAVVSLIGRNMDGVKANRLVMRLGNCIMRATYNARDMEVMKEVVQTMGMKLCERMLDSADQGDIDLVAAEVSQAGRDRASGAHANGAGTRRPPKSSSPSSCTSGEDVVEGPSHSRLDEEEAFFTGRRSARTRR